MFSFGVSSTSAVRVKYWEGLTSSVISVSSSVGSECTWDRDSGIWSAQGFQSRLFSSEL